MTRPTGVFKQSNAYADSIGGYADTPKAVLAALALSLAFRVSGGDLDEAVRLLAAEWATLHTGGRVPQKPKPIFARY